MNILAIPATNSRNGLNRQLIGIAAKLLRGMAPDAEIEIIDINDYEIPIYSVERHERDGMPELAQQLFDKIGAADALVISFAEHNGSYTAAWKNIYDWMSRIDMQVFQNTKTAMFATSPGGRGGAGVLEHAVMTAPFFAADLVGHLGVPSFHDTVDAEAVDIKDPELRARFVEILEALTT